ncbi:MAG: hypothetical protein IKO32_07430 [Lachnospiraceae bacterium]|nr:hypothetical protein [Lachnospiraceae bacterium]
MKIELKFAFKDMDELDTWYNSCCTKCAICNVENGKNDPCKICRCEKIYKEWTKIFGRKEEEED